MAQVRLNGYEDMKGILVTVYRNPDADCTNGGVSSHYQQFVLIGEGIRGVLRPSERNPALLLQDVRGNLRATPVAGEGVVHIGGMFGGNFIYSSDSRFPSSQPIKIFDRFES